MMIFTMAWTMVKIWRVECCVPIKIPRSTPTPIPHFSRWIWVLHVYSSTSKVIGSRLTESTLMGCFLACTSPSMHSSSFASLCLPWPTASGQVSQTRDLTFPKATKPVANKDNVHADLVTQKASMLSITSRNLVSFCGMAYIFFNLPVNFIK